MDVGDIRNFGFYIIGKRTHKEDNNYLKDCIKDSSWSELVPRLVDCKWFVIFIRSSQCNYLYSSLNDLKRIRAFKTILMSLSYKMMADLCGHLKGQNHMQMHLA